MRSLSFLPLKNLLRRPGRMIALLVFAALFSVSVFGGTALILGMRRGLDTVEAKLGADIVVVPATAKSQFDVNAILLQGQPGYFYMNDTVLDEVSQIDGVKQVSAQVYLASTTASCCSSKLQIIGFDPETDFTIQPWIQKSFNGGEIGYMDVIVGSDVGIAESRILRFYDSECHVAGQFAKTGSTLDSCVYANFDTMRTLIASSQKLGLNAFGKFDPNSVISTVLVDIEDGYEIQQVVDKINLGVRKVKAVGAKELISGVADSLKGMSGMIGGFIIGIWLLCMLIMTVVFTMIVNERKREFAVLRVIGMSGGMLTRQVIGEAVIVNAAGGLIGAALAVLIVYPFGSAIAGAVNVPMLLPGLGTAALLALATVAASALVGALISAAAARRISRIDTSLILREGE